ncbi:MAG: nucleotidyl transferase AbiEii/AbiGii toxin family protein [Acidobacteriia bacterium]|nr:nucleotidyl transferase AbiEii/AbiGii toxin family protein [Terriglobia bacterium]
MLEQYVTQVRLLLSVLPDIAREPVFALKGGTAIKLFYRDMPRVSVDIDLTYLPVAGRESSLDDIDASLDQIAQAITARKPRVKAQRIAGGGINDTRILVSDGKAQIKIETSPVTRGAAVRCDRSARILAARPDRGADGDAVGGLPLSGGPVWPGGIGRRPWRGHVPAEWSAGVGLAHGAPKRPDGTGDSRPADRRGVRWTREEVLPAAKDRGGQTECRG